MTFQANFAEIDRPLTNVSRAITSQVNFAEIDQSSTNFSSTARDLSFNINVTFPHGRTMEQGAIANDIRAPLFVSLTVHSRHKP